MKQISPLKFSVILFLFISLIIGSAIFLTDRKTEKSPEQKVEISEAIKTGTTTDEELMKRYYDDMEKSAAMIENSKKELEKLKLEIANYEKNSTTK